jgi:phosphoribosylformylglycinamidine (FGAM) synthase-like enzyme
MNALRFGAPDHPKTKHLVSGVVAGVGGYGNSFGVPTVGGEVNFDARYNGNILVNAFAAGLAKADAIFYSKAKGVGLPVVYLGAKTGRDGVGGATMASAEFDDKIEEKRPTVQVGDPFTEKRLLEACLELMATGAVIAIQDMGAAGLTCSAVEMGAKGDLGIELELDKVPVREERMTAYEMMLSESQERMLMVLRPRRKPRPRRSSANGASTSPSSAGPPTTCASASSIRARKSPTCRSRNSATRRRNTTGRGRAGDARAARRRRRAAGRRRRRAAQAARLANNSSRRWVYEQYDTLIQGNSLQRPGGDAGVVRVEGHATKALAFSSDVTPRYCEADPYEGGKQAVAECWRNLTATGADPLAATDNLNFGNPERPEIMGQLVHAIKGIGEACRALEFPIVSGNVSLYNETNGRGILPTPTIGGVGLIDDWAKMARIGFAAEGEAILLSARRRLGGTHLGQSIYLRDIHRPQGRPAAAGRSRA